MEATLANLLILQERDMRLLEIETMLKRIPLEVAEAESKISKEREMIELERVQVRELEVQRKSVDSELKAVEAQLLKFKNQQLAVKKNEEYEALNHEISSAEAKIGALEEQEIGLLLNIDEANEAFAASEQKHNFAIKLYEDEISTHRARESELSGQLETARAEASSAREPVDPQYLAAYDRVKNRKIRAPWVVALNERQCTGCHLKVAGDTETEVLKGGKPVHCNSCGRLLYR